METLTLCLQPEWEQDTVCSMVIEGTFQAEKLSWGEREAALDYPEQAFGGLCPFPDYRMLYLRDDVGKLPYHTAESPTFYTSAVCRGIYLERRPEGMVRWGYRLYPRVLPEGYRSSPYYDFRSEPQGLNGSGMFAFILPTVKGQIMFRLFWDLSLLPEGSRGIISWGEGSVEMKATTWEIRFSLFQVGLMHSIEQAGLGVYWFREPYFDVRAVAERLLPIYQYMKEYFQDSQSQYRVFLRRDPFEISGGGSACPYAFISGYSAMGGMDEDTWFNVLIHEMTHTWPAMTDFQVGEGTWFSEGATELYCTMLPYRGGFIDGKTTAAYLNNKITERYYRSPYRELGNAEIPKIQWKDRRAQTVPYGRGFLYLANVDHRLRCLGKGSIDDIVRKHSIVNPLTPDEWEAFVLERLGAEAVQDFRDMVSGKLLVPDEDVFGREFRLITEETQMDGKNLVCYRWEFCE